MIKAGMDWLTAMLMLTLFLSNHAVPFPKTAETTSSGRQKAVVGTKRLMPLLLPPSPPSLKPRCRMASWKRGSRRRSGDICFICPELVLPSPSGPRNECETLRCKATINLMIAYSPLRPIWWHSH